MSDATTQLRLLWRLRYDQFRGGLGGGLGRLVAAGGLVSLLGTATGFAITAHRTFSHPAIVADGVLTLFLLLLVSFLAAMLLATWPVVTASIDDSAELSRFSLFPVTPNRLFLASVLAGAAEARGWPVWGALLGTATGFSSAHGHGLVAGLVGAVLLVAFATVWGRVGLHALLLVLRERRSAEAMGGGLLLLLAATVFVPPPDLSWLKEVTVGEGVVDDRVLRGAIALFTLLPSGGFGWMLASTVTRDGWAFTGAVVWLLVATAVGYVLALRLLVKFHAHTGRALPQEGLVVARDPGRFAGRRVVSVLVEREVRDLLWNPRVRVMVSVPFLLVILLRLIDARGLATTLLGPVGESVTLVGVTSYAALVLAAGLSQNAFGFDGGGVLSLLQAPLRTRDVLLAKNLAHATLSMGLALSLAAFSWLLLGIRDGSAFVLTLVNAAFQSMLFVGAGDLLSVLAPQRYHASLKRRDRPPTSVVAAGFAVASVAVLPVTAVLRAGAGWAGVPWLVGAAFVGAGCWAAGLTLGARILGQRRDLLVRAIVRR